MTSALLAPLTSLRHNGCMTHLITPPFEKRFVITAFLIALLAYLFWTGSRYPALDEKAMMSGAIQLEDALSFEAKFPVSADMGLVERVFWSTLNWINTNKKGMTFGILFAAAFLTLAPYLRHKSFAGSFSNSVLGMAIGTPLGVCVNCAAPIARGLYSGGMRVETTLAAMMASPTLNIVVLTLAFSLLPLYMVLAKIALSLVVILIAVPLIARALPQKTVAAPTPWSAEELGTADQPGESLPAALRAVAKSYAANLWYIVRMTVPLMLLAGFLGTVAAIILPAEMILGLRFNIALLVLIAAIGLFLPVPIAFDVVVVGMLLGAGLEPGYVMALLFTLGSFSIYSFFIVAQTVSMRVATLLSLAVLGLGVLGGIGAHQYHDWQSRRALELLLGEAGPPPAPPLWGAMADQPPAPLRVEARPFAPRSPAGDRPFTRLEADQAGIDKPMEFSLYDMWPPFWEGRSLSSGDIDRDGDLDLVIASTEAGLYLYDNDGHGRFSRLTTDIDPLAKMEVFNAALVDMNNDGWPDLFITTYQQGNYLLENVKGDLGAKPPQLVPNREGAVLSIALSFADADRDGTLDVALGNWTAGWYRRVPGEESRNRILWNRGDLGAAYTDLPAIPGETLSILFSDINGDGAADLLVGNDFEIPDAYYYGDGAGGFELITHQDGVIPHTTTTTMAIKTGDLMNDGVPEIYLAQIAGRSSGVSDRLKMQPLAQYCDAIENPQARATCARNMEIKSWYKSGNNFDPTYAGRCQQLTGALQGECKGMLVKDLAIQRNDPNICKLIPVDQPRAQAFCDLHFLPIRAISAAEAERAYPQILRANVMLERAGAGYDDTATARGLEVGGWSWDTKFGDFDNDGWLDVYIVNGTWVPNEVSPSNLFFHNQGDGTFAEASGPFGLEDYLMTATASAFDMDGDGDLDIVSHPVNGPVALFRNNTQDGAAIALELIDMRGNRDGIGAVITLHDELGQTRTREVQLGGGFMSFDAPRVHVGLGEATEVTSGTIRWADGTVSELPAPLKAGALYRITRL